MYAYEWVTPMLASLFFWPNQADLKRRVNAQYNNEFFTEKRKLRSSYPSIPYIRTTNASQFVFGVLFV